MRNPLWVTLGVLLGEARNPPNRIHPGGLARRVPEETWYTFIQVIQLQLQKSAITYTPSLEHSLTGMQ